MSINSIEIMCVPCSKCEQMKRLITDAVKQIETQNRIKINYDFKHTPHLRDASQYSVNPSQAPIVLINGSVELSGSATKDLVDRKMLAIHRG